MILVIKSTDIVTVSDQDGAPNWISITIYNQKEAEADAQETEDLEENAQQEFKTQLEQQVKLVSNKMFKGEGVCVRYLIRIKKKTSGENHTN